MLNILDEFTRSDNGSEFVALEVKAARETAGAIPSYIAPGSPWQNGFVESFHGKLRDECLDREVFLTVKETQVCWTSSAGTIISMKPVLSCVPTLCRNTQPFGGPLLAREGVHTCRRAVHGPATQSISIE